MSNKSYWHYLTLAACCCLALSSLGLVCNCVGVFYSPMAGDLGVGRGTIAVFATICTLLNGFAAPLFRRAILRFPLKPVLCAGILISALSTAAIAAIHNVWQLYLLSAIQGASMSFFCSVPVNLILSNWFEKNHGMATGIAMCFSGLGGAVFSPLFSMAITHMGWRPTYALLGLLVLLIALPGALFVLKLTPAERNLLPYGATGTPSVSQRPDAAKAAAPAVGFGLPFVMLSAAGILAAFNTGISQHLPGFAESVGLGTAVGATMLSAVMLGNLSSKLIIGVISDWLKPIRACLLMLSCVIVAIMLLIFFGASHLFVSLLSSYLIGYVYGVASVGMPLVTKQVFGLDQFGLVYPRINVAVSVGSACALAFIGFIYDFTHSYTAAFLCCASFLLISGTLMLMLQFKKSR